VVPDEKLHGKALDTVMGLVNGGVLDKKHGQTLIHYAAHVAEGFSTSARAIGKDNANLMKIARPWGINISKEVQSKPGVADNLLVNKIIDDMSPDELNKIRAPYAENTRFCHAFGDVGPEAGKVMGLQTYFPDLKIPSVALKRSQTAIGTTSKPSALVPMPQVDDLVNALQKSRKRPEARQHRIGSF